MYPLQPAEMYARHVIAENVCLTVISLTVHKKQMWIPSRRKCSTLSARSTWQEDVRIVANAAVYVRKEFRYIYSIVNISRILMSYMENIRREKTQSPKHRLLISHLMMQNQVL